MITPVGDSGPLHRTALSDFDRSRLVLGMGMLFSTDSDWSFKLDYRGLIGSSGDRDHGLQLEIGKRYRWTVPVAWASLAMLPRRGC